MTDVYDYEPLRGTSVQYHGLLGFLLSFVIAGLGAAHYMDVNGHWVTGMNNHVVWGVPHVFAVFLIVAASGALNAASLASVFGQTIYKPLARTSTVLAICLLLGGLAVLTLDLGRPERIIEAMLYYNFSSVFTWNVFLYSGFVVVVGCYLVVLMRLQLQRWLRHVAVLALVWRFVLTSGTGFIFGFLVARDSYDAALLAPLFLALSLSAGSAVFLLVVLSATNWAGRNVSEVVVERLARLLAQLTLVTLYLVLIMQIANAYVQEHAGFVDFVLVSGGGYPVLFWIGFVLFGSLVPAVMLFSPIRQSRVMIACSCVLIVSGAICLLWVLIIAGQAFPMDLLSGYVVQQSTFLDGAVAPYAVSAPEALLGLGGVAFAGSLFVLTARVLPVLPASDLQSGASDQV